MRKNSFVLDKFSVPQNHPLYVGMQVYPFTEKEIHINDLVHKVLGKRRSFTSPADEARVILGIGLLIALGKIEYYRGFLYRT